MTVNESSASVCSYVPVSELHVDYSLNPFFIFMVKKQKPVTTGLSNTQAEEDKNRERHLFVRVCPAK